MMKTFKKSLLKWRSIYWPSSKTMNSLVSKPKFLALTNIGIDYLASDFIKKIKEFEKIKYDEEKKLLMINEEISERERVEFLFLIDLFGYTDLFHKFHAFELHVSEKKQRVSLCQEGEWCQLKGKNVFNGMLSPRFWLEWQAIYKIINKRKALESGIFDSPTSYGLLIKARIQEEMSRYVLEVGDKNSVSWFYDADIILNKKQGAFIKPVDYINFGLILRHARDIRSAHYPLYIKIEFLRVMAYGPVDEPYLGLWEIKRDLEGKKMIEIYQPILSKIDQIKTSLTKGNVSIEAAKFQAPHQIAQDDPKSKILPKEVKAFVVYLPTSTGIGIEISEISEQEIRREYFQKINNYSLFIYTRNTYIKVGKELKPIDQMDERIYKLLVIFLRQKDMLIPPIPLYRKAWADSPLKITSIQYESDVSPHLKTAISELRTLLKDVPDFKITKARQEGYICKGKFRFCVILPKDKEKKYILSEAKEQEDISP